MRVLLVRPAGIVHLFPPAVPFVYADGDGDFPVEGVQVGIMWVIVSCSVSVMYHAADVLRENGVLAANDPFGYVSAVGLDDDVGEVRVRFVDIRRGWSVRLAETVFNRLSETVPVGLVIVGESANQGGVDGFIVYVEGGDDGEMI